METSTKRNILIWSVIILVLLNVSSLGTIWYHRYMFNHRPDQERPALDRRFDRRLHGPGNPEPGMPMFILRDLGLTDNQKEDLSAIWKRYGDKRRTIEDQMMDNRMRMAVVIKDEQPDTSLYYAISKEQGELIAGMERNMLEMNLEIRSILTKEQLPSFLEKMDEMGKRMQQRKAGKQKKIN